MRKEVAGGEGSAAGPEPGVFRKRLLDWYWLERRDLPWRATQDPYRVWVSEVMLQQTRVDAVKPRYGSFLQRFPTLAALATASEEEVLAAWSGLGYYRRARHLHASAGQILRDHAGSFPRDRGAALRLPGVGVYIAHAVLSIAYGVPLAVVDGNVVRVLSRIEMIAARSAPTLQQEADRLLDPHSPGDANQALMELGATVCTPLAPRCDRCPLEGMCAARAAGRIAEFPPPSGRSPAESVETSLWIVIDLHSRIWIEKRETPPLRGMWMLPWREGRGTSDGGQDVGVLRHAIMSRLYRCWVREIRGEPERVPGPAAAEGRWVRRDEIAELLHSSLLTKALELWDRHRGGEPRRGRSGRDPGAQPIA